MTDRTELRPAEREALYAPDRRLNAYYFGFDSTGSPAIDAILSAVAGAGKGYHHTEGWDDKGSRWGDDRSHVDVIQAAAHEAAVRLDAAEAALARVRELHRESRRSMSALYPNLICECGKDYPCPTITAIGVSLRPERAQPEFFEGAS